MPDRRPLTTGYGRYDLADGGFSALSSIPKPIIYCVYGTGKGTGLRCWDHGNRKFCKIGTRSHKDCREKL